jgi:hypothetical protein
MPTPEEEARKKIDEALEMAGWKVQDFRDTKLSVASAILGKT